MKTTEIVMSDQVEGSLLSTDSDLLNRVENVVAYYMEDNPEIFLGVDIGGSIATISCDFNGFYTIKRKESDILSVVNFLLDKHECDDTFESLLFIGDYRYMGHETSLNALVGDIFLLAIFYILEYNKQEEKDLRKRMQDVGISVEIVKPETVH